MRTKKTTKVQTMKSVPARDRVKLDLWVEDVLHDGAILLNVEHKRGDVESLAPGTMFIVNHVKRTPGSSSVFTLIEVARPIGA